MILAGKNEGLIVPGYTHLQRAQPVLLQHLLLAYVEQVSIDCLIQFFNYFFMNIIVIFILNITNKIYYLAVSLT